MAVVPVSDAPDGTPNEGFLPGADTMLEERFNEVHFHVNNRMRTVVLTALWEHRDKVYFKR